MTGFKDSFDFEAAIMQTKETGYFFAEDAITKETRTAFEAEIDSLPLEVGDHVTRPINAGKQNEVRQQHQRLYIEHGNAMAPVANMVIAGLAQAVNAMKQFPELRDWKLTEIGYQRYRHGNDFIGAHRDRATDKILSITYTITGSAPVRIFETLGNYWDYTNLKQVDEFVTTPGSVMLLRAPGLGNGEQVVHQVLPPLSDSRSILNLRMRPTILEQPSHPKWQQ
jgi:hypothetical protein